ncbi:ATP-binding protein [Streptomyces sp. NPDC050617]|uniref:ATP-binding protein n=1 Tax=Streptomyces sp. NPDC050617 TaxID=3154628 RepID=UPI0034279F36
MSARARPAAEPPTLVPSLDVAYRFVRHRSSAGRAREVLRQQLQEWGVVGEVVESAQLLLSELVANAVEAEPVEVREVGIRLALSSGCLRVEAVDTNEEQPVSRQAEEDDECGRGLAVVAALADAWGVTPREVGKAVWAELAIPEVAA